MATLIIPTNGLGSRLGLGIPKVLTPISGIPALKLIIESASKSFKQIIVVVRKDQLSYFSEYYPQVYFAMHNETNGSRLSCLTGLNFANPNEPVLFQWSDLLIEPHVYDAMLEAVNRQHSQAAGFTNSLVRYSFVDGMLAQHESKHCYGLCGLYSFSTAKYAKQVLENSYGEDVADCYIGASMEKVHVNVKDFGTKQLWEQLHAAS